MNTPKTDYAKMLNEDGSEKVDVTPLSIAVPFQQLEPVHLRTRRIVAQFLAEQAANNPETEAEMDDFDCGDDDGFQYAFEEHFDHMEKLYLAEKARRDALAHADDSAVGDAGRVQFGEDVQSSDAGHND